MNKLKYEKWSKYRFKQPKCRDRGPLKSQKMAKNEFTNGNNELLCSRVSRYNFKHKIKRN